MPKGVKGFQEGNTGRQTGSTNKLTKTVRDTFESVFNTLQKDPKAKLSAWAKNNPTDFYKIASKLIPSEIKADVKVQADISLNFGNPSEAK